MAPNMLSTKDLSYLADIFEWNFNACKKSYSDCECISSEQVKNIFMEANNMHRCICEQILTLLGGQNE